MLEADNLITFMYRMSWKSGSLNLLEFFGPHRACYGTPFTSTYLGYIHIGRGIFGPKRDEVKGSEENYILRNLMICTPHHILCGDKIEKNEMGGAGSVYGGRERRVQDFGGET